MKGVTVGRRARGRAADAVDGQHAGHRADGHGPRLTGIDALRGVGALMVLGYHGFSSHLVGTLWTAPTRAAFWAGYPFLQGFAGVHLFLVVSGFCIHSTTANRSPDRYPAFGAFCARRFRRLYGPYIAAVGATVVALVVAAVLQPGPLSGGAVVRRLAPQGLAWFSLAGLVHVFMLFPVWTRSLVIFGNPALWTLSLEAQLYLMYFPMLWLRRRLGMGGTLAVVLAVTLAFRYLALYGVLGFGRPVMSGAPLAYVPRPGPSEAHPAWLVGVAWITTGPARWFEWVLGAAAAEVAAGRGLRLPFHTSRWLAAIALVGALACQWSRAGWLFTDLLWGVAFFVLVNRTAASEASGRLRRHRLVAALGWVGTFSYSLYLVHQPLLRVLQALLARVASWPGASAIDMIRVAAPPLAGLLLALFVMVALPIGVALVMLPAWLFHRVFELPAIRWSQRRRAVA